MKVKKWAFAAKAASQTKKGVWEKAEDFVQDRIDELKELMAKLSGKVDEVLPELAVIPNTKRTIS